MSIRAGCQATGPRTEDCREVASDAKAVGEAVASRLSSQPPMIDHQAAVLHHLDSGSGELLCGRVVSNPELEPDRPGLFDEEVIEVCIDVPRAAKDIDEIDLPGHVRQLAVDRPTENLLHFRIVDRDWNHLEPDGGEVPGHVKCRLVRLSFGLDSQNRDSPYAREKLGDGGIGLD